jgi:hypothetical protein
LRISDVGRSHRRRGRDTAHFAERRAPAGVVRASAARPRRPTLASCNGATVHLQDPTTSQAPRHARAHAGLVRPNAQYRRRLPGCRCSHSLKAKRPGATTWHCRRAQPARQRLHFPYRSDVGDLSAASTSLRAQRNPVFGLRSSGSLCHLKAALLH